MQVSKEKAIATFTYPYQSYGISFALDEINYEELYRVFIDSVSYTHLTLPTIALLCRSRWSPYH